MERGGQFLKGKDVKKGATVEILDEGRWENSKKFTYEDGTPQKQCIFSVKYEGEEKQLKLNKASRVAMIDAFGDETRNWVGKRAKLIIMPTPSGNDKMIVLDPVTSTESAPGGEAGWDEGK